MNISSLVNSANFKPLVLNQKQERKYEGKPLPCPEKSPAPKQDAGAFGVILDLSKDRK